MFGRRALGNTQVPSKNTNGRHHMPRSGSRGVAQTRFVGTPERNLVPSWAGSILPGDWFLLSPLVSSLAAVTLQVLLDNKSSGHFESAGSLCSWAAPSQKPVLGNGDGALLGASSEAGLSREKDR